MSNSLILISLNSVIIMIEYSQSSLMKSKFLVYLYFNKVYVLNYNSWSTN